MLRYKNMLLQRSARWIVVFCLHLTIIPIQGSVTESTSGFVIEKDEVKNNTNNGSQFSSSTTAKDIPLSTVLASTEKNHNREEPWETVCSQEKGFHGRSEAFLNYMLRIKFCDVMRNVTTGMEEVCQKREHARNEYYEVAYLHWCDNESYRVLCLQQEDLENKSSGEKNDEFERKEYTISGHMDEHMTKEACRSVEDFLTSFKNYELYNSRLDENGLSSMKNYIFKEMQKSGNVPVPVVKYTEWHFPIIPFCEQFTCGASYARHSKDPFSVYDCMPSDCKAMVSFSIFFDATLSILILIANAMVLAVAARTKIMRNIPGYFKISLAIADLTVGAVVLPSCIYTTYAMYMSPLPFRYPGQLPELEDYISRPLANFMGFFGILSFSASVYTMAGASLDRYLAITKPFQYRQGQYLTKRRCVLAFGLIWLIAFIVAIFPVFAKTSFDLSAFNLIISSGIKSSIVYAAALLIPLLAVWGLNGAMLKQVCADRENRSSIRATTVINSGNSEHSLVKKANNSAGDNPSTEKNFSSSEISPEGVPAAKRRENHSDVNGNSEGNVEKYPVTRNVSASSIGFQKKRSGVSLGDGAIERLKRQRNKQTDSVAQRKPLSRQLSVPNSAASIERRLARTLAIMIGAFTIALLPNIATMIAYIILASDTYPDTQMRLASTLYLSSRILLSNSFWNCIIYSIRNRHFRRAMWALFLFKKEKIDRKLRESISMSQRWKGRSVNGSVPDKQSLSKTSSTASSYVSEKTRRSILFLSVASNSSPCYSRKASSDILALDKEPAGRTVSCNETPITGILKTVSRSKSVPDTGE